MRDPSVKAGSFGGIVVTERRVKRNETSIYRDVSPNGTQVIVNKGHSYNG